MNKKQNKKRNIDLRIFQDGHLAVYKNSVSGKLYYIIGKKKVYIKSLKDIPKQQVSLKQRYQSRRTYRPKAKPIEQSLMLQTLLQTMNKQIKLQDEELERYKNTIIQSKEDRLKKKLNEQIQMGDIEGSKKTQLKLDKISGVRDKIQNEYEDYQKKIEKLQKRKTNQQGSLQQQEQIAQEYIKQQQQNMQQLDEIKTETNSVIGQSIPTQFKDLYQKEKQYQKLIESQLQEQEDNRVNKMLRKYREMYEIKQSDWMYDKDYIEKLGKNTQQAQIVKYLYPRREEKVQKKLKDLFLQSKPQHQQQIEQQLQSMYQNEKEYKKHIPVGQRFATQISPLEINQWKDALKKQQEQQILDEQTIFNQQIQNEEGDGACLSQDGITIQNLIQLITIGILKFADEDWKIFLVDKDNLDEFPDINENIIFIFFFDIPTQGVFHFTTAIWYGYSNIEPEFTIYYFDPLRNKQRIEHDIKYLEKFAIQSNLMIKIKENSQQQNNDVWQIDDSFCGLYCFIFINNIIIEQETYLESIDWDEDDEQNFQKLTLDKKQPEFIYI